MTSDKRVLIVTMLHVLHVLFINVYYLPLRILKQYERSVEKLPYQLVNEK